MEFIKRILDLPVIVQGALGSFLFWLAYEGTKRLVTFASRAAAKYGFW